MGLAQSSTFRGSAAFFAMLLAAASGLTTDVFASSDQASPAVPQASSMRAPAPVSASKFTRRRLTLAQRRV